MLSSDEELGLRRERMASFLVIWREDSRHRDVEQVMAERRKLSPPALELLEQFPVGDVDSAKFCDGIDPWSEVSLYSALAGRLAPCFFNQLVNDGKDAAGTSGTFSTSSDIS
jgi:hypothetical protein